MRLLVLAVALFSAPGACGETNCTADFKFGLSVSVVSGLTGEPVCSATVIAADGSYRETLAAVQRLRADGGTECAYQGAGERAGTYTLEARAGSSENTVTGIVVTKDACHVVQRTVTIE